MKTEHLHTRWTASWCAIRTLVILGLATGPSARAVDLGQFTPDSAILGYSVFATSYIKLPDNSGLADGGAFGTQGNMDLGSQMSLRAPRLYAGGAFTLGGNTNVPKAYVGGNLSLSSGTTVKDTLQVLGGLSSGAATITFDAPVGVRGNLSLTGSTIHQNQLLRLGGTWNVPGMTFGSGAKIEMAAATGAPSAPAGTTYNKPWTPLMDVPPHVVAKADLPAYAVTGYAAPGTRPAIDLSSPANFGTDKSVQFLSSTAPTTTKTAYYWKCNLGSAYCSGDTLLPGYYGALRLTGNSRALLLKEGFYAFSSIEIGSANALVAAQPTGGRTVVYSDGDITSSGSNAFIGPDSARLATGFGGGSGEFLGGTMMVAGAKTITIPSDLRIWATISAPKGTIHFSSQVTLFGQAYADSVIGDNNTDFGKGAFIPFRGLVPALFAPGAFTVGEKADPACVDTSGRPCRDTVLVLSLPYTTAYTVKARYRVLETSPRQAILDEDFPYDTGRVVIPPESTTFRLRVRVYDDSSYEGPETFRIVFDSIHGAGCPDASGNADTTIKSCDAVGTIVDDDHAPYLRVDADSSVHEGDLGRRAATFTVRLIDPVSGKPLSAANAPQVPVSFRWRTGDGSATRSDRDYLGVSARRDTLPFRGLSMTLSDSVLGDTRHERDEWFLLSLDSVLGADPSGRSVLADSGWILDDDSAPGARISDATVQEPSTYADTAWALVRISLSRPSGLPVTVRVRSKDGTARSTIDPISGIADFAAPSYAFTIPADSTGGTLRIPVLGDTLHEGSEAFRVLLDSIVDAVFDDSVATVSILDADSEPTVSIDTAWVVEPLTGTANLVFRLHVSRPSGLASSITLQFSSGTALAGADFRSPGSLGFGMRAGLRDTSVAIEVLADSIAGEGTETMGVSIVHLEGARPGIAQATGYIVDAQGPARIVVGDIGPFVESDTTVRFPVSLDWYPADTVKIPWRLAAGTAPSGERWLPDSGTIVVPPGARFASVPARLRDDLRRQDGQQDFFAVLGTPVNARYGDSLGRATLLDDGDEPFVSILGADTVKEGETARLRVHLAWTPINRAVFSWSFVQGTASATDVGTRSGRIVFEPGSSTDAWIETKALVDTLLEGTESFRIRIDSCDGCEIRSTDSLGVGVILDVYHRAVVEIKTPIDSLRTNQREHVIEWTVDGTVQPRKDTSLVDGWNRIVRTHVDSFGRVSTDTHVVWGDFVPPEVRVFKIVGKNPLHPERDTTWWGDRARTRFGVDTIWYWVRDSAMRDDGSWSVSVDTLFAVTDFSGDGVFPTQVSACDELGNCGVDTGWIDLKQSLPQVTIDDPKTGQKVKPGDVPVDWHVIDGGVRHDRRDEETIDRPGVHEVERCWTDDVGNTGCATTYPVADTVHVVSGLYVDLDHDGRIDAAILTLDVPWVLDSLPRFDLGLLGTVRKGLVPDTTAKLVDDLHMLVRVEPPFDYGVTGFAAPQTGWIRQSWIVSDSLVVLASDSFPIRDGVAPTILDAEIRRVENYRDPDTIRLKVSEPVSIDSGSAWLEVGSCPGGGTDCASSELVWRTVKVEGVTVESDGRLRVLVQPGDTGSVRPGYVVRFLAGVTDTLGNRVDTAASWSVVVRGAPRPDLVTVDPPTRIPVITSQEQKRSAPGGILIRASRGSSKDGQWWEPGRGYVDGSDPTVQDVCPDEEFCSGPTLYINRPVRMVLYIYDLSGTHVISRTVDITQDDIDALEGDKIDRLHVSLEWNHRSAQGEVVGTGIYIWRIVAQTLDGNWTTGIQNIVWKTGVKVPRK